jgi:hypothetical protein
MKANHRPNLITAALIGALAAITTQAQTAPKLKMTTDIPPDLITPDSVETRLGTLRFLDGMPDKETTQKVFDNLDFQRGVQAFQTAMPGASLVAMREGLRGLDRPQVHMHGSHGGHSFYALAEITRGVYCRKFCCFELALHLHSSLA